MRGWTKLSLLLLSMGMITLSTGSCFFRFLGDAVGDWAVLRAIP